MLNGNSNAGYFASFFKLENHFYKSSKAQKYIIEAPYLETFTQNTSFKSKFRITK